MNSKEYWGLMGAYSEVYASTEQLDEGMTMKGLQGKS